MHTRTHTYTFATNNRHDQRLVSCEGVNAHTNTVNTKHMGPCTYTLHTHLRDFRPERCDQRLARREGVNAARAEVEQLFLAQV